MDLILNLLFLFLKDVWKYCTTRRTTWTL